ncbi:MAG: acyltransferase [Bacteroidetes bacterium]|nr:acyltransferase [Bacteroidota bacterium]
MILLKERSVGLDLVRSIAILLVLFSHSVMQTVSGVPIGMIGVEIFFVLSGFLIGQILVKDFMNGITLKGLFRFWIRRWMRTLPIYYIIILLKFIIIDSSLGGKIFVYFFFLQNNFIGIDFYPVSWSLVIEEWFYLLLPIGILIFFKKGISDRKEKFIVFLVACIIVINIARFLWVLYSNRSFGGIFANVPFRLDSLLTGVLAAAVKIIFPSVYKNRWQNKYTLMSGLFLFIILVSAFGYSCMHLNVNSLLWTRTVWFFLISFSFALMIPYIDYSFTRKVNFLTKAITWVSLISYSLYLLHPFIYQYAPRTGNLIIDFIIVHTLLFVVCTLSYRYIEKPVMNLREKIKICA